MVSRTETKVEIRVETFFAPPVPPFFDNDVPLSGSASAVLFVAREQTVSRLDCLGIAIGGSTASATLFQLGQPIPGSKRFDTPGAMKGTSTISRGLAGRFGKSPVQKPLARPKNDGSGFETV